LRELSYADCITYGPAKIVTDVSRVLAAHNAPDKVDKAKLLALRGYAYGVLEQYEKAQADFTESLLLSPDNLDVASSGSVPLALPAF
jgi:hypothetical protein